MANGINWIGIDDSADKWTIAQYVDSAAAPAREFELVPSESGYRKLIGWLKQLGGEVRVVYEAGLAGTSFTGSCGRRRSAVRWQHRRSRRGGRESE